jgi:membrane fusion protein, multidrug efflux system
MARFSYAPRRNITAAVSRRFSEGSTQMIEHEEHTEIPINGRPALPEAPERKALPPAPGDGPRSRRRSKAWLWLLLLCIAGFVGYRSYQNVQRKNAAAAAQQERRAANRAVPVAATPARRGDLPIYLRGLGTVDAYNTVNVHTRVDGPLTSVNFREGQKVTKGQVLAEIDPRTFQATVNQGLGQLARDEAQLHDAEANLARYQALWQAGVIARQQLDTQAAQVGQFKGNIAADQATIQSARLQLGFTKILAPMGGRIGLRQVDVGNIVHPGDQTPIAVITQMQPIAVLFTIPADQLQPVLAKLRVGAKLPVQAYDRADRNLIATGTLETVDNQIDPNTGTSRLKAVFPNTDNALFPQQFVNARLLLETRHGAVLIPAPAVQRGPQGAYVYVVNATSNVTMRPVTLGETEGNDVQITSGIAPGEMVVTDGQDKLQENAKVDVRPENGAPGAFPGGGGRRGGRGGRGGDAVTSAPAGGAQPDIIPPPGVPNGPRPVTSYRGAPAPNGRDSDTGVQTYAPKGGRGVMGADRTATPDASGIPAGRPVRGGRSQ